MTTSITPPTVVISDGSDTAEGATTDIAVTGDNPGTASAKLRGIGIGIGALGDAAVTSDANGSLSAKLRGLVKMLASMWDSVTGAIKTVPGGAAAANILNGYSFTTTSQAATTLITIPAGRTWVGTLYASCTAKTQAASTTAGEARAVFATAGVGVTPAAGNIFGVTALNGNNAAGGTVGGGCANFGSVEAVVIAPGGNSVTITVATTQVGDQSLVDAGAVGQLL